MTGNNVYLDNSATTRPFDEVIAEMSRVMADGWHNPSAAYSLGTAAEAALNGARAAVLSALGMEGSAVFCSGGTEADNLALFGTTAGRRRGVVTTAAEHPAVLRAAERLRELGCDVTIAPVKPSGEVDEKALLAAVGENTALVSAMHVNNETGAVNDIAALALAVKAKAPQALFHSDGVQAFLRVPAELGRTAVDLYTVSGHKIHGPKGVGALAVKKGVQLSPVAYGGGQEGGLRSGTENTPAILGFAKAIEVYRQGLPGRIEALRAMKLALARRLLEVPDAVVNGPRPEDGAPHILNMSFPGVRGEVLLRALAERTVFVSTGSACGARSVKVSPVLLAMGIDEKRAVGAIRLSLSPMNTMDEMDRACEAITAEVTRLRRFQRR